jgi:hypothetical protein
VIGGRLQDCLQVHLHALALADEPTGEMADRMDVRIANGAQDPCGDPIARLGLPIMDGSHDPVGVLEHVIGQIQRSIFQDVQLNALK